MKYPLFQLCGQFPQEVRDVMRIRLDGVEFSYGSEEYVKNQNVQIAEYKQHDDYASRSKILVVYREEQGEPKEKELPPFKPEQPRYPHIGV